jgi:hypothetical protein
MIYGRLVVAIRLAVCCLEEWVSIFSPQASHPVSPQSNSPDHADDLYPDVFPESCTMVRAAFPFINARICV